MPKLSSLGCALAILWLSSSLAQAQQTKVGMLTCKTSASLGLIVGSHQKLRCSFTPDGTDVSENYTGTINRLGLDIGIKGGGVMAWAVLARTNEFAPAGACWQICGR